MKWCFAKACSSTRANKWLLRLGLLAALFNMCMAVEISLAWDRSETASGREIGAASVVRSSGKGTGWLAKLVTGRRR